MRGGALKANRCIKNLLRFINVLQRNSVDRVCLEDCCTKPYLGPTINGVCYNTRVISLYNCQGNLFTSEYLTDGVLATSSTFRIQDIQDDCCTLLILSNNNGVYSSTGQCVTVDIGCICAVKCLSDEQISNL